MKITITTPLIMYSGGTEKTPASVIIHSGNTKYAPAPQIIHSRSTKNALRPLMPALRPPTPSRSDPDGLRMTPSELKLCKINENTGSVLQLACCAPGLTTPGRAFRKVRGSLGGASHEQGIDQ